MHASQVHANPGRPLHHERHAGGPRAHDRPARAGRTREGVHGAAHPLSDELHDIPEPCMAGLHTLLHMWARDMPRNCTRSVAEIALIGVDLLVFHTLLAGECSPSGRMAVMCMSGGCCAVV